VTASLAGYEDVTIGAETDAKISAIAVTPGTVTLVGSPVVGQTLAVNEGTWSPSGTTFGYRWYRDGEQVATTPAYQLTAADLGATMSVVVHGTAEDYAWVEATATAATKVVKGTIATTPVLVTGTAQVGRTLHGSADGWTPEPAQAFAWLRDGNVVTGATGTSYQLTAADLGAAITFRVTGTLAGYTDAVVTSPATATVAEGTITPGTPTLSGTAQVGETLTVNAGTWTPTPSLAYQWYRSGTAIPGATTASYTAVADDLSATLKVVVTGTLPGYADRSVEVSSTTILEGTLVVGSPTVDGTAKVGRTLTALPGSWTPGTSFSYQWSRGSTPVGANAATYTPTPDDLGKAITVKVTGTNPGYRSASDKSDPTDPVVKGDLDAGAVTISGPSPVVGRTLTAVTGSGWTGGSPTATPGCGTAPRSRVRPEPATRWRQPTRGTSSASG